jgi:hypothetical protein
VTPKLAALHYYHMSMPAPAPPSKSFDHDAAARGQAVFGGQAKCASCHVPPLFVEPGIHDVMRKLWTDHVTYTRLFIVSAAASLPDKDATTQRLLRNQADIGNAVGEYYGKDAGSKLTELLRNHIMIAADLVGAAKAGNKPATDSLNKKWRANAEQIAVFLHTANPKHWPEPTLRTAMYTHLDQTLSEATHRLKGDYAADIKDYDAVVNHILAMADILSDGIVAQFPGKFSDVKRTAAK